MYKFWLTDLLIYWVEYLPKIHQNHDRPVGSHPDLVLQVFLQAQFCSETINLPIAIWFL